MTREGSDMIDAAKVYVRFALSANPSTQITIAC